MNPIAWNLIEKYFEDKPYYLVAHHLDSFNDFFSTGIFQIFRENNPIRFIERNQDGGEEEEENNNGKGKGKGRGQGQGRRNNECFVYLGGKDATKLYFGKPIIYDSENDQPFPHFMYPNDARLRNMNYGVTIHYDIDVEFILRETDGQPHQVVNRTFEKIYLGRFPIMLHSNLCILKDLSVETRFNLGECRNDVGGYFIISGKEKVIVSQEKFGDNMLYVRKNHADDLYSHSCEIHSVSEDSSKPIRFTSVKLVAPSSSLTNNQLVVDVPNVKKPVPLFILMRALGVISDKAIIETCLLDMTTNSNMVDLFIPSVHDANQLFTQELALEYMAKLTKRQTVSAVQDILINYLLPHIGEDNYLSKAYFLGIMVNKVLRVSMGKEAPTDRDNFKFKRIETSGSLIYDLFREFFLLQKQRIFLNMDKLYYYHAGQYKTNFVQLVSETTLKDIFKERILEDGFKKGFKGAWGGNENTRRVGLVQDLNRLSWFTHISHLRKVSLPLDPTAKVVGPHLLHSTQWGVIDPVDTPDGGNIGLHKHLAISTVVSSKGSAIPLIRWIRENTGIQAIGSCRPETMATMTKVMVNGNWIGVLDTPMETVRLIKLYRRNGVIPIYTSVSFHMETNVLSLYTDNGRLLRPVFYTSSNNSLPYDKPTIREKLQLPNFHWDDVVAGFAAKPEDFRIQHNQLYLRASDLYPRANLTTKENTLSFLEENKAIIDYMDVWEEEGTLIATTPDDLKTSVKYTHCEIDPSLMFGVMGNSIIYPESNQFPRNCYSCGQSRQAVSVYHSNHQMRMDKMGVVLNYGQTPLIKSRYLNAINREEQPYGVNAIVAIMSYTGYNVEDAILINAGSVKRGLFNTTYYTTYEAREESSRVSGSTENSSFANVPSKPNVQGTKEGFDYSYLDEFGLVKENTAIDDRIVLIGQVSSNTEQRGVYRDASTTTKKGQLGFVDKAFISEGEEGFRIAKIRIREERLPAIGDKMASRAGQKGTVGLIIPEEDMPFTADGIRPDLIINPHALPSRMTIGQLVESLFGKVCCTVGGYGDCTAFATKGANYSTYGSILTDMGFHQSGNQLLYNGFTGEQIHTEIFIGPTYYMRLKHMVKDKINYRAMGKRNFLTRQTNQGRANDGGLKLGEMERDGIMANGLAHFLNESYMVRGDEYYMGVCNNTGAIAIYNPSQNLFLSPLADGPLVFNKNLEGETVLEAVSKFGRSFSIVRIPFAMKLLIQELQAMNVQMRIITEDNVEQLMNLSYQSKNLDKLLGVTGTGTDDVDTCRDMIYKLSRAKNAVEQENRKQAKQIQMENNVIQQFDLRMQEEKREQEEREQQEQQEKQPISQGQGQPMVPINFLEPNEDFTELVNPTSLSPAYVPDGSPAYAPDGSPAPPFPSPLIGGGTTIFHDPVLDSAFNRLSGSNQAKVLQLPMEQRGGVMNEIVRQQTMAMKPTTTTTNSNLLQQAFQALPMDKQLGALEGGYRDMAMDFKMVGQRQSKPIIRIRKPVSMTEQLAEQFPILSAKEEGEEGKDVEGEVKEGGEQKGETSFGGEAVKVKKLG